MVDQEKLKQNEAYSDPDVSLNSSRSTPPGSHTEEKVNTQGPPMSKKDKKKLKKEKKKGPPDPNEKIKKDLEAKYEQLPPEEANTLREQTAFETPSANFFTLYRFCTRGEAFFVVLGIFFAIVHGVALPMFTLVVGAITTNFNSFIADQSLSNDSFQHNANHNSLYFVYIGVGILVSGIIESYLLVQTGEINAGRYRKNYLKAIIRQNIAYFDILGSGQVATRITNDTASIQEGISEKLGNILQGVATFITAIVIAFTQQWKLTCILLSVVFFNFMVMGGGSRFIIKFEMLSGSRYTTGSTIAEEALGSIRSTVAFGLQDRLAAKFDKVLISSLRPSEKSGVSLAFMLACVWGALFFTYALSYWEGSRIIASGEADIGKIVCVIISMLIGSFQLGNVAPNVRFVAKAIAAAKVLNEAIDRVPVIDSESTEGEIIPDLKGEINLEHVKFRYPSRPDVLVLPDLSLRIPAGETVALVGMSGSGKSTIVGILERFYLPLSGSITLDGVEIDKLNVKWLRQQIGFVQQEPTLFADSIYENIAYGLIGTEWEHAPEEEKMAKVEAAAREANAYDFIQALTEGFHTNVGDRGFLLSGGQKQRIAIARAIVSNPKILLLDEATSALDTKSEGIVQDALDHASEGRTTIVIAHRLSTIRDANKIVVMSKGEILEQGTHQELLSLDGYYKRLVDAQQVVRLTDAEKDRMHSPPPGGVVGAAGSGSAAGEAGEASAGAGADADAEAGAPEVLGVAGAPGASAGTAGGLRIQEDKVFAYADEKALGQDAEEVHIPGVEKPKDGNIGRYMKLLWKLNKKEHWMVYIGAICMICLGYCYAAMGQVTGHTIKSLIVPKSMYSQMRHDINVLSAWFFFIGCVAFIVSLVGLSLISASSHRLVRQVRLNLFRQMLRLDIAFFDHADNSPGALSSILAKEARAIEGLGGATMGQIMQSLTTLIGGVATGLPYSWRVGLVALATVPILLGCGFVRVKVMMTLEERGRRVYEGSGAMASQFTSAVRTVQSLTREEDVAEKYAQAITDQIKSSRMVVMRSAILYGLSQGLTPWVIALIFWWGSTCLRKGQVGVLQYYVVFMCITLGAQAAGQIFSYAPDMGKAREAASNIYRLLTAQPLIDSSNPDGIVPDPESVRGDVEFKDVHFRYPTRPQVAVLRGLNLSVKKGQYIALVGASGCGKSTTIGLAERFYDVESGEVLFDGHNVKDYNLQAMRSHIALVQQEPILYSGTIRENITMGWAGDESEVTDEMVYNVAKKANIHDFVMSLPDGYNTVSGSRGSLLSGGQKQRIAIARALIRDPKLLLLDEATSALDSESEKVVQTALDEAAKGRTTIAIAHRLSTIQKADIIYVFDQGVIVEQGNHMELLELNGRYAELVRLQSLEE